MRTPFGKECKYYYADYFRGRETQACRLIEQNPASEAWKPALCQACPVPDIVLANACPHLALRASVVKSMLGLARQVHVQAACREHRVAVKQPKVGCGHCHEYLDRPEKSE